MIRLGLAALVAMTVPIQEKELGQLANVAREIFETRDFGRLFGSRQPVRLELPSQPSAVSVRGEIAAATLASMVRRTADLEFSTIGSAVVVPGHGYIEIRRRFRVLGTQEDQRQRILIGARYEEGRWRVTEVWVTASRPPLQ